MTNTHPTLTQLISQHCPDGVEFLELGEIGDVAMCKRVFKNQTSSSSDIPFFTIGTFGKDPQSFISEEIYKEYKEKYSFPNKGDILISASGTIGRLVVYDGKPAYFQDSNIIWLQHNESIALNKFLYYIYSITNRQTEGGTIQRLYNKNFKKVKIPIPPLPVQTEIVRILDTFTKLEAELEAELEARKSQYEYYRDDLLSFEDDEVEWKELGEVGEFIRGNGLQKTDFVEDGFPCIHYGQIYTYYGVFTTTTKSFVSPQLAIKLKRAETGDVIITNTSENLEDVGKAVVWCGEGEVATGGHATIFKSKNIIGKYFAYYTQTKTFFAEKRKYAKGTKVIDVSATDMKKIKIPVPYKNGQPDLEKQQEIVTILDKFDALVNDISIGLPAELQARRQQYEYYRNKLLTFAPLEK